MRFLHSPVIDLKELTDPTGVFHLNTSLCLDSQNADENDATTKLYSDYAHDDYYPVWDSHQVEGIKETTVVVGKLLQ